ncbi:hypothetical protein [Foetidibacter luteolus]|uniref:hypothetical protein n=1 Tax=Foetidibacter luteolus TaxID=2608880 RepID=UPI00129A7DEF|nr:hypothetical protein [Foetidibacter luteolus]
MEILIDVDEIGDASKREWLLQTLKLMGIEFQTSEQRQSIDEYNKELEEGDAEIERGEFILAEDLKKEIHSW